MARLPYVDPARAAEPVREALEVLPPLNLFRMLAHAETAFPPFLQFGGAVLTQLELDPGLRELAILAVAHHAEAEYEWVQHVAIGKHAGLSDEQIAAVRRDPDDPALGEAERAVLRLTAAVVHRPRVSDEVFAAVREHLGPREIVELLLTVGNYLMLARVMTTLEIEIDPAAAD